MSWVTVGVFLWYGSVLIGVVLGAFPLYTRESLLPECVLGDVNLVH